MEKNKVSIIIPVYNAEKFIGETMNQLFPKHIQIGKYLY